MSSKGKIFITAVILAALSAGYIWGIPAIVNLPARKALIEQKIYEKTGIIADVGNPELSMGTFPSVWVKSNYAAIINSDGSKALYITNPKFKLKLLPLIFKRIEIDKISASSESINLVLTQDKNFLLGDYSLKFSADKKFSFEKASVNLGPYIVNLDDKLNNQTAALQGEYFQDAKYIRNKKVKFATVGNIRVANETTDFYTDIDLNLPIKKLTGDKLKIEAGIKDFKLESISDYVNILSKGKVKELDGILNFNANTISSKFNAKEVYTSLTTDNLRIIGEDAPSSIIFPDKLNVDINFETIDRGINFQNTEINSKDIQIKLDGKITQSGKKIPAMDLTVDIKPTKLEQLRLLVPGYKDLLPDIDLYAMKKYFFAGNGEGKLRFVGQGSIPKVFGDVKLGDVYVIHRIPNTLKGGDVGLNFVGHEMNLDVFVPVYNENNVTVKGIIKIDGSKYSELDIKNVGDVPLGAAQEVINPLHEIFKFKMGPVPIMKLQGWGGIDVSSKGRKIDPHIWGNFYFKNATAEFNDIHNLVLKNANGTINFEDTKITFKTTSGSINGKTANIYGNCDVMGKLNVFAKTFGQKIPEILKVINTSKDMADVQKVIKPFKNADGIADLELNIYGTANDVEKIKFNKDLFAKGKITFHNATTILKDTYLPLHDINGIVNFDKKDADFDVNGFVRNSQIVAKGKTKDNILDLTATSDRVAIGDIMDMFQPDSILPYKKDISKLNITLNGNYKGIADGDNLDYDKVTAQGKIIPNINSSNLIKIKEGSYKLSQGILSTDSIKGLFNNNPFTISFVGTNVYKNMKIKDAEFNLKGFNISSLEAIKSQLDIPLLDKLTDFEGYVDLKGYIKDGKIWSDTNLNNLSCKYKPTDGLIKVLNGKANIRANTLYLGNINLLLSSMPVLINGNVADILSSPVVNLTINTQLNQMFFDRFFNSTSVYPVKVKGDVDFYSKIRGTFDRLYTTSTLNIGENSSLYYMGATIEGDQIETGTNPVTISADAIITPNSVNLATLNYKQLSQNILNISGDVRFIRDNILAFKNFKIKTFAPMSAKVFNILLKKPTIKQGTFTSDLTLNGTSSAPYTLGSLNITGLDIPFMDTVINDIDVNFKNDYINLNSSGTILNNDINLNAKIKNNPKTPYIIEDVQIKTEALDLNLLAERFNEFDTERLKAKQTSGSSSLLFSPEQIIIKNADIIADKILIKKAEATDFISKINLRNNVLKIDNFTFNLANGKVDGKISTDLNTMKTDGQMRIENADAQIISENFFDMPGQMYGTVTGDLTMSCVGSSSIDCVKTLSGEGHFDVLDGRMPKLGSLEYLLKAANLVTGGVTGVSINSIIDLITPLKTGNFESITGDVKVKDGIANDIEVYSHGKDLNMYMTGSYNITNLIADMDIYGSLSRDFSTIIGKISNMSLNRLLNSIPGVNINDISPDATSNINKIPGFNKDNVVRVFKSEIYGDINGSNYVRSFKWIKN